MAAVLSPKSLTFPHDLLHDNVDRMMMDRQRPLLPPIASLIQDVDKQVRNTSSTSPEYDRHTRISQPSSPDRISLTGSPRAHLSSTSPLPGTSSFDFTSRTPSSGSPTTNTFSLPKTSTNPEAYVMQRSTYPPVPEARSWSVSNSPNSSRRASDESSISIVSASSKATSVSVETTEGASPYSGLAQQRPLPSSFQPVIPSPVQTLAPIDSAMAAGPYQHHHHYSGASSPTFPPSTDRYQCPTCQKAFSRPSSLKIHTYSHTGEKPFRCKYDGCGKFFSVRSNMKRHEKGCHGAETSSIGSNSPRAS